MAISSAIYGYSHLLAMQVLKRNMYAYLCRCRRVKVPKDVPDEKLLFISDAIPTGYMGAEFCNIQPGILAVWGCGAVGLFAMISAI